MSEEQLKKEYLINRCDNKENYYSKECNQFLLKKELIEHDTFINEEIQGVTDLRGDDALYPDLNDPNFIIKIAEKKEFNDTQYDGEIHENIKEHSNKMSKAEFELAPHQIFVRNFLSFQTPYNSLLLYHGLGSGKTQSAIGVCEEMRIYLKQMGISKRIIIVASPTVQDNFRLQLFDDRKLELEGGIWKMKSSPIGNNLLREVIQTNMKNLPKEKIINLIKSLINNAYLFLGYDGFANYIIKTKDKKNLKNEFQGRLIVIDEIHNIRITEDNENKKVAIQLMGLVKSVDNMRLLLLSATPMYNSYKEIIWLINLMNANDRRGLIEIKDVFDKNGNFKSGGKELLIRKATGYISYVRGDNPYLFPYRIYPYIFNPKNTFDNPKINYPKYQMNGKKITKKDQITTLKNQLFLTKIGEYQSMAYKYIIDSLRKQKMTITTVKGDVREMPSFENMESFGYTLLQIPIQSLIISYPLDELEKVVNNIPSVESYESTTISNNLIDETQIINELNDLESQLSELNREEEQEKEEEEEKEEQEEKEEEEKEEEQEEKEEEQEEEEQEEKEEEEKEEEQEEEEKEEEEKEEINKLKEENKILREKLNNCKKKKRKFIIESTSSEYSPLSQIESNQNITGGDGSIESNESIESSSKTNKYIDVHDLTGRKGLSRIMKFVDNKSPPEKGEFEYKSNKYGRIFSQEEIGKYSNKIKFISEQILSSEGIVLIYSQYIDGGLIPMALVLEEMGIQRYGGKNLFKKQTSKKNSQPIPSYKYILISGDPRLSPHNDKEVKAVTSENNSNGEKIKIILISKAGSEGVDFKFIRQVHVLEPWYNMNRIEQILGRAVRNMSHKDLEFEKRNVEIYLHTTLLENNNEEAADLYIYRVAEYKSIQMGKINRLLKEIAVDCILNHDQINFTQKNMSTNVKQILSNGKVIDDFPIGDVPNTAACDYMDTCEFKCIPNKEITQQDIKEDTYNESFILLNNEKILQKIKELMKERFFYKKKELITLINSQKIYPLVQIYAALTLLVDDNNETIIDKYGRLGYLTNIGEYYLFQPNELPHPEASIYERSMPLDYKHDMIEIKMKDFEEEEKEEKLFEKESEKRSEKRSERRSEKRSERRSEERSERRSEERSERRSEQKNERERESQMDIIGEFSKNSKGFSIIQNMQTHFDLTMSYMKDETIEKGEDDWYKHCGYIMYKLMTEENISKDDLYTFLVEHMIDILLYKDKLILLNYLTQKKNIDEMTPLELIAKTYMEKNIIHDKNLIGIILYDVDVRKLMILDETINIWKEGQAEDERDLSNAIKKMYSVTPSSFYNYIGFIGYDQKNNYLVFKIKDMTSKRNKGARCDQATKAKTLILLNKIVGFEKWNKENTKKIIDMGLCIIEEFTLRSYNKEKKDGKIWFLSPEMAKLYKIGE